MRLLSLLVLSLWLAAGSPGFSQDVVWSGLVYATNEKQPAPVPTQLLPFSRKLENIFGYNQLELLSEQRKTVDGGAERWLLPGKGFSLCVHSRKDRNENLLLDLQLYREKRLLVKTQAKLRARSPIFFRGPLYGKGQLIIVLLLE